MTEHIVAVFQSEEPAAAAVRELEQAGIPSSAIRKYAAGTGTTGTTSGTAASGTSAVGTTSSGASTSGSGFWAWVLGEESSTSSSTREAYPDESVYSRHYEAGNTVVSVTLADDSKIHEAITIIDAHNPLDVDESTEESSYTSGSDVVPGLESGSRTTTVPAGTDYSSSASLRSADTLGAPTTGVPAPTAASRATATPAVGLTGAAATGTTTGTTTSSTTPDEQVVQLSEEQLNIGTRTVERGTTRVRRYVVSTPVEKEVTLHGERVTIERRRPVSRTGSIGPGAFEERIIEVRETEEVPVVEKTARVVEEVAIRREATERTETVRDTVRREELEVAPDKQRDQSAH